VGFSSVVLFWVGLVGVLKQSPCHTPCPALIKKLHCLFFLQLLPPTLLGTFQIPPVHLKVPRDLVLFASMGVTPE